MHARGAPQRRGRAGSGVTMRVPGVARPHGPFLTAVSAALLALLAAACSGSSSAGSGSSSAGGSSTSASAVAYSACVRAHGVPNFPDPDSSGTVPKGDAQHFGVSTAQFQAAQQACQHLLPTSGSPLQQREEQCIENGGPCPPALLQQMLTADRTFAQCMRLHGWPNFPDPIPQPDGPVFNITAAGISDAMSHSHRFETTLDVCERLVRGNAPYVFG
jgi:hypothetical protein